MAEFKQNAVSATVWPWTGDAKPSNAPKGLSRRVRALIQTVIMVVIAGVLYKFTRHGAVMSKVVLSLAAIAACSSHPCSDVLSSSVRCWDAAFRLD